MEFEWDEAKRLSNIAKHGIDFQEAAEVFDGRPILVHPSPYAGEERFLTTGLLNMGLHHDRLDTPFPEDPHYFGPESARWGTTSIS